MMWGDGKIWTDVRYRGDGDPHPSIQSGRNRRARGHDAHGRLLPNGRVPRCSFIFSDEICELSLHLFEEGDKILRLLEVRGLNTRLDFNLKN